MTLAGEGASENNSLPRGNHARVHTNVYRDCAPRRRRASALSVARRPGAGDTGMPLDAPCRFT